MHSNSPICSAVSPPNCTTPGVLNGQVVDVKANWVLPDGMTRHEGGREPRDHPHTSGARRIHVTRPLRQRPSGGRYRPVNSRHRRDVRALGRQRTGGQAHRTYARRRHSSQAVAQVRQPGLRRIHLSCRGCPHRWQGAEDRQEGVRGPGQWPEHCPEKSPKKPRRQGHGDERR